MTRDTYRVHDSRDIASDEEIHAALWAAAEFPRLPDDAPPELTKLAIDIDDPKRVYAIHRASRRHHFQSLVERYILQIRYGCKSKACTTPTCFSCRKRLAGAAPVRRYNSTSARTLAVYMASQENPEKGLCNHPSAERPLPPIYLTPNPKLLPVGEFKVSTNGRASGRQTEHRDSRDTLSTSSRTSRETSGAGEQENGTKRKNSMEEILKRKAWPDMTVLEEPETTDHRSFVQNVFGTVAFKMIEWLTPRNLDLLVRSQRGETTDNVNLRTPETYDNVRRKSQDSLQDHKDEAAQTSVDEEYHTSRRARSDPTKAPLDATPKAHSMPSLKLGETLDQKPCKTAESNHGLNSPRKNSLDSTHHRRAEHFVEPQCPKGILHKSTRLSESTPDIAPFTTPKPTNKPNGRLSRQTVITSPRMSVIEQPSLLNPKPLLDVSAIERALPVEKKDEEKMEKETPIRKIDQPEVEPVHKKERALRKPSIKTPLPQSISHLTIETIGLFCDILQTDGTAEKHMLQPREIGDGLERLPDGTIPLRRVSRTQPPSTNISGLKKEWRNFIEQSLFDVLGKPESLLTSFSDDQRKLFDTQTIWYLMLRVTRVAPSLVFDSLWQSAGNLFRPPEILEEAYDWAKEPQSQQSLTNKAMSSSDAAQTINICLHALVAAAPLVFDARQLANMSRIRSYGLAMLGRESSSLEPVYLCLWYEDAFTNELALRLARRVFAAIITRRRFSELIELQKGSKGETSEPDILEAVLGTLKFLDLGTPPTVNFPNSERDLHEKRIPTLMLDWARTVMLQDWDGSAEVPNDGPFGGALATIAAIYKNRKSLLLGDIHFRTEYFAERLDPVDMPLEWLGFQTNRRTVHLLDYPYLFNPSTLVTYFRAINYSRMNQAYEQAKAASGLMYSTMAESGLMTDEQSRDRLKERLNTATSRFMVLKIRRKNVLLDTFNAIWRREKRELMRPLKIRLGEEGGEEGLDSGGVQQEFFRLAIAEALNPDYGTFTVDSRTRMAWFQPGSPEPLWKFELIGMVVSLAVYNGLTLPVTFPKALYRKLLGEDVSELHHIADGWPDLTSGLTSLLEWDEKDGLVEDIFARTYEFSVEQFGQPVSREMDTSSNWPQFPDLAGNSNPSDAPLVTNENRNSYVSDYIRWLTDISVRPQYEAFKAGFFACVDRRSIRLFDPEILQSVVEGIQEIDISEMRRATRYIGWDASHRTIKDFWSIVKRYDLDQKRKLLEFVTASDRVPVGGMRNLQFTIQRNGVDDSHLPSSYTCYGILLLPEYSGKEVLREKLAMALENSKGFGFA